MSDLPAFAYIAAVAAAYRPVDQPPSPEIKICPFLFVKQMGPLKNGYTVPQHAHEYPHLSMLAVGAVYVWKDGKPLGRFDAPTGILIEANAKHTFAALVDGTLLYCIHAVDEDGEPRIVAEHQLAGGV